MELPSIQWSLKQHMVWETMPCIFVCRNKHTWIQQGPKLWSIIFLNFFFLLDRMNERLYILSIDGNRKKLYKTCMRSGFRSVYILLLACTTSTKQHELLLDFEHHFRLFSTTAMMPSGRIRKIRSQPNFKRKFFSEFLVFR